MPQPEFERLRKFLGRVPSVRGTIGTGREGTFWWAKFHIDPEHDLAWRAVQEFACVLNYLSVNDRLPTVFKPVSPAPYLNGGPEQFLSWVIESTSGDFSPDMAAEWLEGRMPRPVDDMQAWRLDN